MTTQPSAEAMELAECLHPGSSEALKSTCAKLIELYLKDRDRALVERCAEICKKVSESDFVEFPHRKAGGTAVHEKQRLKYVEVDRKTAEACEDLIRTLLPRDEPCGD